MNIICIILGILFIAIGILFFIGKANIKIEALCRNVGIVIGLAGGGFLIAGFVPIFASKFFIWYMIAWFVGAGFDARYISKSEHYKNNA